MQHFTHTEISALHQCLATQCFVVICEPSGLVRKVNSLFCSRLGYQAFELIGQPVSQIIHYDESTDYTNPFTLSVEPFTLHQQAEWQGTLRFMGKNKTEIWCHGFFQQVIEPNTKQVTLILIANELTEYRAINQSRLQSEKLLQTLMCSAPVGIAHTNIEGTVIFVNDQWCELSECESAQLVGQPWFSILSPEHQNIISQQWLSFMTSGIVGHLKHFSRFRIQLPQSNRERWIIVSLSSVDDQNVLANGYLFSIQDITQLVSVEKAMEAAKLDAQAAYKVKSDFLTNVSHEIRTPMNGILGMAEVTLNTDLQPDQKRYLNLIMTSGRTLLSMMNEILDFSKIEAGKMELSPIPFKLRESLDEIIRLFAHKAYESNIELLYKIHSSVPNALIGDITRIRQIMGNLINNAIKFTLNGHIMVELNQLETANDIIRLALTVQDTGIGIADDQLDRIFQPFIQADTSTSRRFGGTGLGLSITRELLELMNGTISVTSTPGQGSRFYAEWDVQLNVNVSKYDDIQPANMDSLIGLRILIADDNRSSRDILAEVMAAWQMQPTLVDDGQKTLLALKQAVSDGIPFDLALLDAHIQNQDGFALATAIKGDPALAATRIIMLPSFAEIGQGAQCRRLGIEGYLTKPVSQQELLQCLLTLFSPIAPNQLTTRHAMREQGQLLNVLVVEDDETNRFYISHCLRNAGCEVLLAATADEARQLAKGHLLDVILMDLHLPDTDGLSLTRELRQFSPLRYIPIIAVTANVFALSPDNIRESGLDAVVSKPFASDDLLKTIRQVVTHYQRSQKGFLSPDEVFTLLS